MKRPVQASLFTHTVSTKNDSARRKRLGQYFTGDKLARLLVALSEVARFRSVIDPMCGRGDMLAAVRSTIPQASLAGIEIDNTAYDLCGSRFRETSTHEISLIRGNAFSWSSISYLPRTDFDLVITNPPYVRYQSLAGSGGQELGELPRAEEIRQDILDVAENLDLEEKDRGLFLSVIREYSGLSDLAVPSWILCMMLTAVGGRLAMVVPESWLNRDYAYPIHYLLLKLFRIHYVVEDANRAWFEEVQVKTTLLIAERIPQAENLWSACSQGKYIHASLPASAITEQSIVGGLFPHAANPEEAFAKVLVCLNEDGAAPVEGLSITRRDLKGKLSDLLASAAGSNWLRECEPELTQPSASPYIENGLGVKLPQALLDLLPPGGLPRFITIEELGAYVGQGLRTGANEFFYCDLVTESENDYLIRPGKSLKVSSLSVPKSVLRPVLRKQSEAPRGYVLVPENLKGRVLILEGFIRPDNTTVNDGEGEAKPLMPPALSAFVTHVEHLNLGTEDEPKFIPQMSAVRTNETKDKNKSTKARFWYMLPKLAKRHLPDLFIPRINYLHPKTFLNSYDKTIIDANFSTIWLGDKASVNAFALLACLNSSWALASMELSAAVMGGGALKLEATHIRRLPIPALSDSQWAELSALGVKLAEGESPQEALEGINRIIAKAIFGAEWAEDALDKIEIIKGERLRARNSK